MKAQSNNPNLSRRGFLATTASVAALGALGSGCSNEQTKSDVASTPAKAVMGKIPVGVQVYSVRSIAEKDLAGTLAGIASVAGFRGLPGAAAYSASKSAAITCLESMRAELHGSGVSVVTVCPGYVHTPMTEVNRYRMPFIMGADDAARRIARAVARKRRLAVIPWQMALVSCVLRVLPGWLYDRVFARAPRKARSLLQ
jgi:NAD(P)-dependent dehydrogenase (short-subunit alcohol dehydrogenase family)